MSKKKIKLESCTGRVEADWVQLPESSDVAPVYHSIETNLQVKEQLKLMSDNKQPELEDVLDALTRYIKAQKDLAECIDRVEYESDWYCRYQYDDRDKALENATILLNQYIDNRVRAVLDSFAHNPNTV